MFIKKIIAYAKKIFFIVTLYRKFSLARKRDNKWYEYFKSLSSDEYSNGLKAWYLSVTGHELNLENPKTLNEKIQWLKLNDCTPLKTKLADKYLVREWIGEKIGEEYLIPLLGVWDSFDEIDFDKLPDQFVLKTNHGSGQNIIVRNKSSFDKKNAKKSFEKWLSKSYGIGSFEMHYLDIPRKIIAEKYIENFDSNLVDYKIQCFNGKPTFFQLVWGRTQNDTYESTYDLEWNKQSFRLANKISDKEIIRPKNLEKMIEISKKLSEDFLYVRVDLYVSNNDKILFGEMTFTPLAGLYSEEASDVFGKYLELPIKNT